MQWKDRRMSTPATPSRGSEGPGGFRSQMERSPSTASLDGTPQSGLPKRSVRTLLRNYYGLKEAEDSPADPTDLNSSRFDSRLYCEQLLGKSSVPELLQHENQISTGFPSFFIV